MLVALHRTLERFLKGVAPRGLLLETANIDFAVPDAAFRGALPGLTLNLYLNDVSENLERRLVEPWLERSVDGRSVARRRPPALIDCSYWITAWSALTPELQPVMEEHQLLGEVLRLLLKHQRIPREYWQGELGAQIPPYPMLVAQADTMKNRAELWTALGHAPKAALSYVVTIAVPVHDTEGLAPAIGPTEAAVHLAADHQR